MICGVIPTDNIHMIEKIKRVSNPLTIIAIFAALAEVSGTVALGLVDASLQSQFIWFVMLFPVLLVLLFFITLNFNPKVLYSPGDFDDETNFMSLNKVAEQVERSFDEILENIEKDEKEINDRLKKSKSGLADKLVMRYARGNLALQQGRFVTKEEIERRRKKMVALRFDDSENNDKK